MQQAPLDNNDKKILNQIQQNNQNQQFSQNSKNMGQSSVHEMLQNDNNQTIYVCKDKPKTSCDQRLKKVDDKGVFQSDDEIGWMFKEILKIQEALNEFTLK